MEAAQRDRNLSYVWGVLVLVALVVSFMVSHTKIDPEGRLVEEYGVLDELLLTLVVVYVPNAGQAAFFAILTLTLLMNPADPTICYRDFSGSWT
ncbi:hypothetical protein NDU88_003960 [Pleurodeles waltl]|uniref:Uncharacterized protein n=1 Tax=Pleurodeles waltl TaxID=8319 RepID=A0AAV7KX13_PLEWA|nr:hypothetical protein NDU88_003960 [Pleurodeles waltl]